MHCPQAYKKVADADLHSRNDDIVICLRYIFKCFKIYFDVIQNESDAKAENFPT